MAIGLIVKLKPGHSFPGFLIVDVPFQGQLIKASNQSINESNFSIEKKTKFIIHGFIDTPLSNWVSRAN